MRRFLAAATIALLPAPIFSQSPPAGGAPKKDFDARDFLRELKESQKQGRVGDEVSSLKDTLVETLGVVRQLQSDVARLQAEVDQLKRIQQLQLLQGQAPIVATAGSPGMAQPVFSQPGANPAAAMLQGIVVKAEELAKGYAADRVAADLKYRDQYVTVAGLIHEFSNGSSSGDLTITLKSGVDELKVNCHFLRTNDFWVEIIPHQGRLVNSSDRTTLVQVGQPIMISGTCFGKELDIEMKNCRLQGITAKPKPERKEDDRRR